MSLILEALKKAERQHKLGEVPGIRADTAAPPSRMRGLGWVMLALFAGIMLGLGIYLGGYRSSAPEPQAASFPSAEARSEAPPAPPSKPIEAPLETVLVQPQETSTPPPKPVPVPAPAKPEPARLLSEMPSGFVTNLPSLNIDIHSYDKDPVKRYVLINMEKYHEGDYLAEGPRLIEIRPDGVVLEHFGERFILPIGNQ
jgi:general secretion pathway protein B